MNYAEAISLIGSLCVRIMGLLIVIAEYTIPPKAYELWAYVKAQRDWYTDMQDSLAIDELLNDVYRGKQ